MWFRLGAYAGYFGQKTLLFGLKLCNTAATCVALGCFSRLFIYFVQAESMATVAINWMDCFSDCEAPEQLRG